MPIPKAIVELIKNGELRTGELDLSALGLDDEDINELIELHNIHLIKSLNLSFNNIAQVGAQLLSTLTLEYLNLDDNKIGNKGGEFILTSSSIKKSSLKNNGIAKATLKKFHKNDFKESDFAIDIYLPERDETSSSSQKSHQLSRFF